MAGGVALNCVANGRLRREAGFERLWIQPAAGDAGGALGAALTAWHQMGKPPGEPRRVEADDAMQGALLGPEFRDEEIEAVLRRHGAAYAICAPDLLLDRVTEFLAAGQVIGWFQGRMEFGPRALGNRSILADPRDPGMQSNLNLKIKFRESFRPFAPIVRRERVHEYFELDEDSPYMLLVAPVQERWRRRVDPSLRGFERLKSPASDLPAVTHVDGSARIQTVDRGRHPLLHALLERYEARTGCGVLVNTSFNVRGEPVVCTPDDAYRCFMNTGMDVLALGRCLLLKRDQSSRPVPRTTALTPD
jgi:carbamoyltransferase